MNRHRSAMITSIVLVLMVASLSLMVTCVGGETPEYDGRIGVIVTILPQADFVDRVGGEKVDITVMVPPGVSPHTFEPTTTQMVEVSKAKVYAKVGSGVEFELTWMDKIMEQNRDLFVIDCSKGIVLREIEGNTPHEGEEHEDEHEQEGEEHEREDEHHHLHTGMDPHIWLSPSNAKIIVQNICEGLIQIDPENTDFYTDNANRYLQELDMLDQYIREQLDGFTNRYFMIYHPSFGYFADEYDLTQLAIEHEGKAPTPGVIQDCIDRARNHRLSIVFVAPQFAADNAEAVARSFDGKTVIVDPLPRYYVANMRNIADALSMELE